MVPPTLTPEATNPTPCNRAPNPKPKFTSKQKLIRPLSASLFHVFYSSVQKQVKVNVVNSQLRLPRINGGDGDEDGDGLGADSSGPSSLAVVRGSSGGSNGNSGLFFDASVLGEGQEGAEAFVGTGGGGVGRGVRGGGGGGRGEGIPRRWRGPAPIHIGGEESLDGIIGEEGGAANGKLLPVFLSTFLFCVFVSCVFFVRSCVCVFCWFVFFVFLVRIYV